MAKKVFTGDVTNYDIIAGLSDKPNYNEGLSPAQVKAKFDEAANKIKTYINSTLIAELQSSVGGDSGAQGIGYDGGFVDNVADALDQIYAAGSGSIPPDDTITTTKIQDGSITDDKISVASKIGLLASLITTEKGNVIGAINDVQSQVNSVLGAIADEQYAETEAEAIISSASYATAHTLTVARSGDYILTYSAEQAPGNAPLSYVRVIHNDTTVIAEGCGERNREDDYRSISGIKKITLSAGDTIKLQLRSTSSSESAKIRRMRTHIRRYYG